MVNSYIKLLRVSQWSKNFLVFTAPFFAGTLTSNWSRTAIAFLTFCFLSSAGYVINDWMDKKNDSNHPTKNNRPFASGKMGAKSAIFTILILLTSASWLSLYLSWSFKLTAICYLSLTLCYSSFIKRIAVLELIALAFGFVLRSLAGAYANNLYISKWFLLLSLFGALYLVSAKRLSELEIHGSELNTRSVLKDYSIEFLTTIVTSTLALNILIYTLWLFENYNTISAIATLLPFTYGLFRYIWHRENGKIESPETLILKDKTLIFSACIILLTLANKIY